MLQNITLAPFHAIKSQIVSATTTTTHIELEDGVSFISVSVDAGSSPVYVKFDNWATTAVAVGGSDNWDMRVLPWQTADRFESAWVADRKITHIHIVTQSGTATCWVVQS